jgi:hypothetical protein
VRAVQDQGSAQEERRPSERANPRSDLGEGLGRRRTGCGVLRWEIFLRQGKSSRGTGFMGSRPTAMGLPSWHACEAAGGPRVGLVCVDRLFWALCLVLSGRG